MLKEQGSYNLVQNMGHKGSVLRPRCIGARRARTQIPFNSSKFFYPPTDAQVNCLKNNIKFHIKTALTCFVAVTPSSGNALLVLAKVTVFKIANYGTSVCGDVAAYISGSLLVCVRCTVRK